MDGNREIEKIGTDRLNIESLLKAVDSLARSVDTAGRFQKTADAGDMETIRAGVIQHFEFTYELCWKFMKRWIEMNVSPEAADGVPRIELFRLAAENRLIDDVAEWMTFHRARNSTSHIDSEPVARDVFERAVAFLPFAQDFLNRLRAKV